MTDNEIIKALELCGNKQIGLCKKCPLVEDRYCQSRLKQKTFELINRQKAEIERLKTEVEKQKERTSDVIRSYVEDEWN